MIKLTQTNTYTLVETTKQGNALIRESLKYLVKGGYAAAKRVEKTTGRKWDGYKSMYDGRKKIFLSGLLPRVITYLDYHSIPYQLIDARVRPVKKAVWPVTLEGIDLYDYQRISAMKFLTKHQGILKLGTGAGKTEVAVAIAKAVGVPMIFLTHRKNLMYQAAERFALRWPEAKSQIGIVGNGQFDLNYLTFATYQTMHRAIKKYKGALTDDLKNFGLLCVDEAHRVGATQFQETAGTMSGAFYRLGLTATPFMDEDPANNLALEGVIGNVIHKIRPSELIKAGVLARPYFKFFDIHEPSELHNLDQWRDVYEYGIVNNEFRNKIIASNAVKLCKMGHKTLIIVQEINHAINIEALLQKTDVIAQIVTGKDEVRARTNALKSLSKGHLDVIICTNIFDEGIDVKDVSGIILAAGTKAAPALFQRTGRALRKKDDGGHAVIIDFMDHQHPMLLKQYEQRYNLVRSEEEFKIL